MTIKINELFKLANLSSGDVADGLNALEQISNRAADMAKNFSEIVGQAKVIFQKVQNISSKIDNLEKGKG